MDKSVLEIPQRMEKALQKLSNIQTQINMQG